jgi:hypothetical protein
VTVFSFRANSFRVFRKGFGIDETQELIQLVHSEKRTFIGFNSLQFDDAILVQLILTPEISNFDLWTFAQTLISGTRNPHRRHSFFDSLDVLEVLRAGFNTTSLKACGVLLKHHLIQDLPIPFDQEVQLEDFEMLIEYNKNDIEITRKVFEYLQPQIEMRLLLSERMKIPLLSESDSGIAKQIFKRSYIRMLEEKQNGGNFNKYDILKTRTIRETVSFKDVIDPSITFSSSKLNEYVEQLKDIVLVKDDTSKSKNFRLNLPSVNIGSLSLKLGLGGIHSEDAPAVFRADEEWMLLDAD